MGISEMMTRGHHQGPTAKGNLESRCPFEGGLFLGCWRLKTAFVTSDWPTYSTYRPRVKVEVSVVYVGDDDDDDDD